MSSGALTGKPGRLVGPDDGVSGSIVVLALMAWTGWLGRLPTLGTDHSLWKQVGIAITSQASANGLWAFLACDLLTG